MKKTVAIIGALVICFALTLSMPIFYPAEEKCACPANDIIIAVQSPIGDLLVPMPKGSLDDPANYVTKEQFEQLLKEGKAHILPRHKKL